MKAFFSICFTAISILACAEEPESWGEWRGGLRIGITCDKKEITADERPVFTVRMKNDSDRNVTLPDPSSYFEVGLPKSNGYRAKPLRPHITTLKGSEHTYSQTGEEEITKVSHDITLLKPNEVLTLKDVQLSEKSYTIGREQDYSGKVTHRVLWLLPDSEYRVQFVFENVEQQWGASKLWTGTAVSNAVTIKVGKVPLEKFNIEANFTLPKQDYFLGEQIVADFTVTNRGKELVYFPFGGDYRGTGRPERFKFSAISEDGRVVDDPIKQIWNLGGLGGDRRIKQGESHTEKVIATAWLAFEKPGKYTITATRTLNLGTGDRQFYVPENVLAEYPVEKKFVINLRQDDAAMQSYLEGLVADLEKVGENARARNELQAIARTRNPVALPMFKDLALKRLPKFDAVWWLQEYGKEKSGTTLVEVFEKTDSQRSQLISILANWNLLTEKHLLQLFKSSDQWEREAGVRAAANVNSESCLNALIAIEKDASAHVRRCIPKSLAAKENPAAIPVLLRMIGPDEQDTQTRIEAATALSRFKRLDGVPILLSMFQDKALYNHRHSINSALQTITGQNLDDYKEWIAWWLKNEPRPPQ